MEHQETANRTVSDTGMSRRFVNRAKYLDFEEFAESVRDWRLDFRQLDRGVFRGEVLQVGLQGTQLAHARFGRHLHQRGDPPPGMRTFVIPADEQQEFQWRGQRITSERLMVFPSNAELESFSRPGFHIYTISVSEDLLGEIADSLELPSLDEMTRGSEVIELSAETMQGLRRRAREMCQAALTDPAWISESGMQTELETVLPIQLLLKIAALRGFENNLGAVQKGKALRRALDHLAERPNEPLSVGELCRVTQVSERTLRRAFLEAFGMPPKLYLKSLRLQGARQQLRSARSSKLKISDVANRWGFWHMGQFAADYRRQFGELPSETRRSKL